MYQRDTHASPTPGAHAASLRHTARRLLDGGKGIRLTLVLGVVVLLTLSVGLYLLADGVFMAGYLLFGWSKWLDVVAYAMVGVSGILVALPLAVSVYRLACLACLADRRAYALPAGAPLPVELPTTTDTPALAGLFHPFTSLRAYGRALALGLEYLGWTVLVVILPVVGYRGLAALLDYLPSRGMSPAVCDLLTMVSPVGCLLFGAGMFLLSGLRAGFGYLALVHDDLPLGEVNRYFRGFRRGVIRPLVLRLSLAGWVILSVVAILVPFVLHTIPYALCCAAAYGAELERR